MLPILADKKGFFREEGLDVRPNYVQTGKVAMDAVVSGDLQFGVIVETNIAFVKFQQGADIKVIASITEKHDDAIVARTDSGIRAPKDLLGKTVAYLPGTTSHRFVDLFIDFYRLDRSKMRLVNLTPPGIQAAILNGTIPAGSIWQPFRYNIKEHLKQGAVQFNDPRIYTAYCLIAVRSDFAKEAPEEIQAFLRALTKAEQFAASNKDEAITILAAELDMAPAVLSAIWDEYELRVQLQDSLVPMFVKTGEWVRSSQKGFGGKPVPSYQDVVDPSFLRSVAPARVATGGGR